MTSEEAMTSIENKRSDLSSCSLCPRNCGVDRLAGKLGICGVDARIKIARAALHMWEEPCISGKNGSGAVFFSGCSMHCVYCQNRSIANGKGWEISGGRLAEIFLELQEQKANNINLVTPTHYTPQIAAVICLAKRQGLRIPVVYNCSGYESAETLRMLDGLVDIYLTDFKYPDAEGAKRYSHAADYPKRAMEALAEMLRQCPAPSFAYQEEKTLRKEEHLSMQDGSLEVVTEDASLDEDTGLDYGEVIESGCMKKGVIVRHLLLPGRVKQACQVVRQIYERFGEQVYFSLMNQYTPFTYVEGQYPEIARKVTKREYERWIDYVLELGVEQAFVQEGDTAEESFIPEFEGKGVFSGE